MNLNIYQLVTDRIIALLESGVIPWKRPWTGVRGGVYSRTTVRPYSLLNQIILGKPGGVSDLQTGDRSWWQRPQGGKGKVRGLLEIR